MEPNMSDVTQYQCVFITGAKGFIGQALVERYRRLGAEVRGLDLMAAPELGIVAGDIDRPETWQSQLDGCDLVIHTAAVVSNTAPMDVAWQVNVQATQRLLALAESKGVKRFVHLSSVAAFGFDFPEGVTEDYPLRAINNPYVDTKIASEHTVLATHANGKMACTIVRPTDVYGPGSRPWVVLPLAMMKKDQFILPANGKGVFSPVYIDNLVDGIVLAAEKAVGKGQIFTLGDGIGVSCETFFNFHHRLLGKKGVPKSVSTPVAKLLAEVVGGLFRLFGKPSELGSRTVDMLSRKDTYSIAKAQSLLGYTPGISLEEGQARTEAWLKSEGYIEAGESRTQVTADNH